MGIFKEFVLVLENSHLKESMNIEQLVYSKMVVDLERVVGFRESFSDDGKAEPYTIVYTLDGYTYCFDITYTDFLIMFHTEVKPIAKNKNE
jgi:hypothetical protein